MRHQSLALLALFGYRSNSTSCRTVLACGGSGAQTLDVRLREQDASLVELRGQAQNFTRREPRAATPNSLVRDRVSDCHDVWCSRLVALGDANGKLPASYWVYHTLFHKLSPDRSGSLFGLYRSARPSRRFARRAP